MQKRIWITWETQRRSIELARKFDCDLHIIEYKGIMRYPVSILRTISILYRKRPDILFVQNPSMILAALACVCKYIFRYFLVVDRHTTFLLDRDYKNTSWVFVFKLLSRLTIQYADITIVTNSLLADMVKGFGGTPAILPDPIPKLEGTGQVKLKGRYKILMISSFAIDEPVMEVLTAMNDLIRNEVYLYVTGNYNKLDENMRGKAPSNVVFTGFLDDQDYVNMLFSCDAIMVLTTASACMLCGCYEAVSAEKPLITSDKDVLKEYFTDAVFVDNTASGISAGITEIIENIELHRERIKYLKERLITQWEESYLHLDNMLSEVLS